MSRLRIILGAISAGLLAVVFGLARALLATQRDLKGIKKEVKHHNEREARLSEIEKEGKEKVASRDRLDPVNNLNGLRNPKK